jgi:hypothetical protein
MGRSKQAKHWDKGKVLLTILFVRSFLHGSLREVGVGVGASRHRNATSRQLSCLIKKSKKEEEKKN